MVDLIARTALAGRAVTLGPIALSEGSAGPGDADPGFAHIEVSGTGTLDLLGVGPLARGDEGKVVMRLAALRVRIAWRRLPTEGARIAVDRFSADYLWHWLTEKARIEMAS